MRDLINLIESYSNTFYHVTESENVSDIIENGFEGGWGDVGFGVYLYNNLSEARAYAERGGWDAGLEEPKILEIKTTDVEKVEPHPDWNASLYENMYWHEMEEGDRWNPPTIEVAT